MGEFFFEIFVNLGLSMMSRDGGADEGWERLGVWWWISRDVVMNEEMMIFLYKNYNFIEWSA
jgi:hypothetical protein